MCNNKYYDQANTFLAFFINHFEVKNVEILEFQIKRKQMYAKMSNKNIQKPGKENLSINDIPDPVLF